MADDTEASAEPDAGPLDLSAVVAEVEKHLIGERRYDRGDIAQRSGLDADAVRALWRALGFAAVDDDERMFTDADLHALQGVQALSSLAEVDADVMQAMTRIIGQSFARLASWQGQIVVEILSRSPELLHSGGEQRVIDLVDTLTPVVAELHDYVWKRQMNAYFQRVAGQTISGTEASAAVGFVDMADFTSFTRRSTEAELRAVLERFETLATETVGERRGQVVKTIGDEVLFVADDAVDAAHIALALLEAAEADDVLPALRAGLAHGPVVHRLGDVFGQTVNIASRLTSVARTGTVLVDDNLAEAIEGAQDAGDLALKSLRPVSVRGYHHLHPWVLRRTARNG